ncbi:MAG TPA: uroporphyrinogen-III synthase [Pyrinomonadaceae bacterium]|jgi:uroporphyrinogen-III synthase
MTPVLVLRKFDEFSRILTENDFKVINCPTIETVESGDSPDLAAKVSARRYDGVFLTSRQATAIAAREIFSNGFAYAGKVYVLGKRSFELLKDKNLDLFFSESANTAGEMLASIPLEDLRNKRFLFVRGEKSLRAVPEFLGKIAAVDEAVVYETRRVAVEEDLKAKIETRLRAGEIAAACFFSPSGAESFLAQFGAQSLRRTKTAAIGKTTADFLERRNLKANFVAAKATAEDFAAELIDYLKGN